MKKYTDLKTFEDACKVLELDPKKVIPDFSCYLEKNIVSMIAHAKLVIIVKVANQLANEGKEWIPDSTRYDKYKYEAWFYLSKGSSGFRYSTYDGLASTSRLCFISKEVCEYVANQFIELYKEYYL